MIQVQGKKYNEKEVRVLNECFSQFEYCADCCSKKCKRCEFKNLCNDIQYVREYLAKIANEKQKE